MTISEAFILDTAKDDEHTDDDMIKLFGQYEWMLLRVTRGVPFTFPANRSLQWWLDRDGVVCTLMSPPSVHTLSMMVDAAEEATSIISTARRIGQPPLSVIYIDINAMRLSGGGEQINAHLRVYDRLFREVGYRLGVACTPHTVRTAKLGEMPWPIIICGTPDDATPALGPHMWSPDSDIYYAVADRLDTGGVRLLLGLWSGPLSPRAMYQEVSTDVVRWGELIKQLQNRDLPYCERIALLVEAFSMTAHTALHVEGGALAGCILSLTAALQESNQLAHMVGRHFEVISARMAHATAQHRDTPASVSLGRSIQSLAELVAMDAAILVAPTVTGPAAPQTDTCECLS